MERIQLSNLQTTLNNSSKVVVMVVADWCGQCKMLKMLMNKIINNYSEITFVEIDADLDKLWNSKEYEVNSVPTFLFFKDEQLVNTIEGYQYENNLVKILDQFKSE